MNHKHREKLLRLLKFAELIEKEAINFYLQEQAKNAIEDIYSLLKTTKGKTMIYAIDFDGTIVENAFPKIGKLNQEAARFIRSLKARGDKWILYTMREDKYLQEALEFLARHDLAPDAANDNLPEMCEFYQNNPRKIFANVYIDDHNAGGLLFAEPAAGQGKNK